MATPQFGALIFVGLQSGQTYSKDILLDDVNGSRVNVDAGAGASAASAEFWRAPESVKLRDYSQVTGTADTEKLQVTKNGVPTGDMLRYSIHLTSLAYRPVLDIRFAQGDEIAMLQISD